MEKTFDPASVEARISNIWEKAEAFKAGRADRKDAPSFSIVIPPPNVTGSLHMGHALNNTLQDILCRFERMRGKDVLWQPGTDHAGIATQMVVERQLMEKQIHRQNIGREKFIEHIWQWKAESGGTIVNQLKRLGASCDWSRERFTLDAGLSKAVTKVFVTLYREKLIYKDKRLVNWDPHFQTAISDLEVKPEDIKGNLWYLRYPLADQPDEFITIATTRPETMLGDVAVAVHPDDERYKNLVGRYVTLPLVGRKIPIVADSYSDPEKGTGAVKITPAHDFNDFEVGKRHNLPLINILDPQACLLLKGNEAFLSGLDGNDELNTTLELHGTERFTARKRLIERLDEQGYLVKTEEHVHTVPHGDRSNSVIEPYLTDQWYVNVEPLAQKAMQAVRSGKTKFVPENWEKTYFQWLENIQPWCISRQLWWGHQIPAWYAEDGTVFVAENEQEAQEIAKETFGHDVILHRDGDVLDTWFSSALWPFSTLGWPDTTEELKRFYPTNALVTGFDIIFFWVARMMMMGLHFMDEIPFHDVYVHALVRDEHGAKMSKSKGNVVDPLNIIDQYGADSLRFTLTAMAAQGRDIKLSMQRIEGYRNFTTKIWNAARFAEMNECTYPDGFIISDISSPLNKWALTECAKTIQNVTKAIETYRFNDAANSAYKFVWNTFCDWYLELAKPVLQGDDTAEKQETRASIAYLFDEILKLLHPFMPFITEELWAIKGEERNGRETLLALAPWSADLSSYRDETSEEEIGWVVDLISEIRSARSETNVPAGAQIPLLLIKASPGIEKRVTQWNSEIKRLARISEAQVTDTAPKEAIQLIIRGTVIALPLEGIIDFTAEKARLNKEIDKLAAEILKISAKLDNPNFISKAREDVIEEQKERRDTALSKKVKLEESLKKLS